MCHKSGGCMNKGPFYYHLKFIICKICFNDSEATKMSPKQWTKPTAVFWEYVVFYFSNFILRISSRHVEFPRVSSWQPTAVRQTISNFYNPFFKFPTFKYKYFVLFNTNRVEPVGKYVGHMTTFVHLLTEMTSNLIMNTFTKI